MKKPRGVAFQGEVGAFSQIAVERLAGPKAIVSPQTRFEEVFQAVRDSKAEAAVIPIENTLHGSVHENYDHLLHFGLPILGETFVRITHNLIAAPGVKMSSIKRVYSHPVALNQCLRFFAAHPKLERVPYYDTAGSVKMILTENLRDAAAIASSAAAKIYGGRILKAGIEDDRGNTTRFFLLGKPGQKPLRSETREWKTSLVFSTRNQPGALFRALSAFALRDISLAKIESRPLRGKPWEYLFYLDCQAPAGDPRLAKAIAHLEEMADFLRVLGTYPKGS